MTRKFAITSLIVGAVLAGCALGPSSKISGEPTLSKPGSKAQPAAFSLTARVVSANLPAPPQRASCSSPDGWFVYQMQLNETVFSLAARAQVSAADLLRLNCLAAANEAVPGSWLYVPAQTFRSAPQTFLPLGISALVADPPVVPAGGTVNLAWMAQGPVVRVQLGWVYDDQFVQEVDNLPQIGTWALPIPADGRESITFMLRASDGLHEVAAQTTVQVRCPESWFFTPAPPGCPTPPLITTFREQQFERGTIVYAPALGVHYVMVAGQSALRVGDSFVPGMPLSDPGVDATIPVGFFKPRGPLDYAWRSDDALHAALGYATSAETAYPGMLQRTVSPAGETVYFSASSGQVYRFASGQAWQIIAPQ